MASLCLQVLGKKAGLAMFCLNIMAQFFVGQGCTIASSRVVFAYSRDGAIPGSRWWSKVNSRTKTPVNSVWFVITIGALLGLLMFASPVAIGAVFSIGAIGQYTAFVTPLGLKLFFAKGKFRPGMPSTNTSNNFFCIALTPFEGPWNLGRFSRPVGTVAVAWLCLIVPVLCFPAVRGKDLNDLTMNYTCEFLNDLAVPYPNSLLIAVLGLIYFGTMMFSVIYYAVDARKWFKGPRVNVEHLIHVEILEGEMQGSRSDVIEKIGEKAGNKPVM